MLSGELLKSHFAKFDLVAMLGEFFEQSRFYKEKFQALRRDGFKSLDKSQRDELFKIAGFKAHIDAKFQGFLRELMQSKFLVVSGVEYKFSELEIYTQKIAMLERLKAKPKEQILKLEKLQGSSVVLK